ncbi:hypothetical protein [Nocardia africana]|uniref:Uncharacterized protein n=1 Tax=Nocardia africana TaxID=134964 RepID=A0A378WPH9_9NOCA|nr:hypothetical protein [Nocardia africana]SUA43148.1 Uncharacterised protein [Nocardia africana]
MTDGLPRTGGDQAVTDGALSATGGDQVVTDGPQPPVAGTAA